MRQLAGSQRPGQKFSLRWGDTAYDSHGQPIRDQNLAAHRLEHIEAVAQNQDNWEHDICDADDYFQFHGGLSAAIEQCSGKAPALYLGDSSRTSGRYSHLQEMVDLVVRARVLNPKWRKAMRQHGYKGAAEIAASIDYCFGWSATTASIRPQQWHAIARDWRSPQNSAISSSNTTRQPCVISPTGY